MLKEWNLTAFHDTPIKLTLWSSALLDSILWNSHSLELSAFPYYVSEQSSQHNLFISHPPTYDLVFLMVLYLWLSYR
jgi:hypothetical protein